MIAIYKCRLCGKEVIEGATANKKLANDVTIAAAYGVNHPDPLSPRLTSVHSCQDGSLGITDFQGMRNDRD